MILYHFTRTENLDGIVRRELVPAIGNSGALTLGIPAVWFTSNSAPPWMIGVSYGTGMCMLTVDINRKHLHHWRSWLANREGDGIDENGKPRHFVGAESLTP
jgi:hypothetical protein